MNTQAYDRMHTDYNIFGLPTVYFDGGFEFVVGASNLSEAETAYVTSIDTCGARHLPDIELELFVAWGGNATITIQALIHNNDTSLYEGHIRVYVAEIVSTREWKDTRGRPYLCTFLDYVLNEEILVDPEGLWVESSTWDGNEHSDGYGNDFGDITQDNIMIIGAVFNAEGYLKYNNPPWGRPFYAHYLDDLDSGLWINFPPFEPREPIPRDRFTGAELESDLYWTGGDPNLGDSVSYDLYFGTTNPPPLVVSKQSTSSFDPGGLLYYTTYYWKVVAWDNHDTASYGPIWNFTTKLEWIYGDCNRDEEVNVSDVVYLLNYLFKQGPAPNPVQAADANCDAEVTVSDVIYLINYLFKDGQSPGC